MNSQTFLVRANNHTAQIVSCSIMDILLKNLPVPVVLFYRQAVARDILIDALKQVLNDFPIFAGRLTNNNNNLSIDCNNQGVEVYVTQEDLPLEQLLQELPTIERSRLVNTINPKKIITDGSPITTIKIAYFSDGGMTIGVCWHHSIGDMQTFICMMQAWSKMVSDREYDLPLIVPERDEYLESHLKENQNSHPNIRYLKTKELLSLLFYKSFGAKNKVNLKIYFSESELARMKEQISTQADRKLSKNSALCSHVSHLISNLDTYDQKRNLAIAVNYRTRVKLPSNILGNFVSSINVPIDRELKPSAIAKNIKESIDNFAEQHLDYFSTKEYIKQNGGMTKSDRFISTTIDPLKRTLLITNWSNFGVYDIVFGDAKPFFFSYFGNSPFPWLSSITEGFNNRGLIYSVWLPEELAEKAVQEDNLNKMHHYRDREEVIPEDVEKLKWLL